MTADEAERAALLEAEGWPRWAAVAMALDTWGPDDAALFAGEGAARPGRAIPTRRDTQGRGQTIEGRETRSTRPRIGRVIQ